MKIPKPHPKNSTVLPTNVEKIIDWAIAAQHSGNFSDAELAFRTILSNNRMHPDALHLLGVLTAQRRNFPEAEQLLKKAIRAAPLNFQAMFNYANVLLALDRQEDALAALNDTIVLAPNYAEAYLNRGAILLRRLQLVEALADFDRALVYAPQLSEAHANRGNVLQRLGRTHEARESYKTAISLAPTNAKHHYNLTTTSRRLGRYDEALSALDAVLVIDRNFPLAIGDRLSVKMHLCDWNSFEPEKTELIAEVKANAVLTNPFDFLAISSSADEQLTCAKKFVSSLPKVTKQNRLQYQAPNSRIHLAYLSGDFHNHATAHLMAGVFEVHNRSKFRVTAISFGPDQSGPVRDRLRESFDRFEDVRLRTDEEIADLIREIGVNILVDLKGYTEGCRPQIFAYRAAPIQVNYLGYPGTTGAPYMDYLLADKIVIPEDEQKFYSEKVVYLPDCYQANDTKRVISKKLQTRSEAGLPDHAFVFCAFNNTFKITPEIFDIWMRLLASVDNSVLWLIDRGQVVRENLSKEAIARGVSANRLVFAPQIQLDQHLARHQLADLFLDTLPYNAHTTASDALWAGLPVVTCLGTTFAGRVAGSLLSAIGLSELIAHSLNEYEILALKAATDHEWLASLKLKLRSNRDTFPLFDTRRFARNIEDAYEAMWETYCQQYPPASSAARTNKRIK